MFHVLNKIKIINELCVVPIAIFMYFEFTMPKYEKDNVRYQLYWKPKKALFFMKHFFKLTWWNYFLFNFKCETTSKLIKKN